MLELKKIYISQNFVRKWYMNKLLTKCCFNRNTIHDANEYTEFFNFRGLHTFAKCVKCHSVSHVELVFYYKDKLYKFPCSLDGVGLYRKDCPSIFDWNGGESRGKKYMDHLLLGKILYIECGEYDNRGRVRVTIYKKKDSKKSINQHLIKESWAYSNQNDEYSR